MSSENERAPLEPGALARFLHTAAYAAMEAGRIQLAERGTDLQVSTKSTDVDLVTRVDRLCEERIRRVIGEAYPSHAVLGEEGGATGGEGNRFRWVVDPLDGTVNYAHGFPHYNASVALEVDGEVLVGAVYDAERNELFTATAGGGAHLNGRPIAVSSAAEPRQAVVATGFSYDTGKRMQNLELFARVLPAVQGVRRPGAAALDVCYVACGRLDAFWEMALNPWDVAAANLILREAGGATSGPDGAPYRLGGELLVATNGHVHARLLHLLGVADLWA